jgi:hypothetical protein
LALQPPLLDDADVCSSAALLPEEDDEEDVDSCSPSWSDSAAALRPRAASVGSTSESVSLLGSVAKMKVAETDVISRTYSESWAFHGRIECHPEGGSGAMEDMDPSWGMARWSSVVKNFAIGRVLISESEYLTLWYTTTRQCILHEYDTRRPGEKRVSWRSMRGRRKGLRNKRCRSRKIGHMLV